MTNSPTQLRSLLLLSLCGAAVFGGAAFNRRLHADSASPVSGTLLQQLSDETQHVYGRVRLGMVRVQLPVPAWLSRLNRQQQFMKKWGPQLDPIVRQLLQQRQELARRQSSSTQPTTAISTTQPLEIRIVAGANEPTGKLILVATGLLVDDQGHAVVPMYVDRNDVNNASMPALTGDNQLTTARFVGSDANTNLTVIQLARHSGEPIALGRGRPADGMLTMVIAPEGGSHLAVWNNNHPEQGLIVLPDGGVAGFGLADNHFITTSAAKPIVDQLIATGEVHRAQLGIWVTEVAKDDMLREKYPALGGKPAIHVMSVEDHSAAQTGGLKKDDLILEIAGEPVGDAPTFAAVIASRQGNTNLRIVRDGEISDLTVDLQPK